MRPDGVSNSGFNFVIGLVISVRDTEEIVETSHLWSSPINSSFPFSFFGFLLSVVLCFHCLSALATHSLALFPSLQQVPSPEVGM